MGLIGGDPRVRGDPRGLLLLRLALQSSRAYREPVSSDAWGLFVAGRDRPVSNHDSSRWASAVIAASLCSSLIGMS